MVPVDVGAAVGMQLDGALEGLAERLRLRRLHCRGQRLHPLTQPAKQAAAISDESLVEGGQLGRLGEPGLQLYDVPRLQPVEEHQCRVNPQLLVHRGLVRLAHAREHLPTDDGVQHGQDGVDAEGEPAFA